MPKLNVQYKGGPTVNDPSLRVEVVTIGIDFPTSMAFLGPIDILVLEKNEGTVKRTVNGNAVYAFCGLNAVTYVNNLCLEASRGVRDIGKSYFVVVLDYAEWSIDMWYTNRIQISKIKVKSN